MADLANMDSWDELPDEAVVEEAPVPELPELPESERTPESVPEFPEPEIVDDTMPELPVSEMAQEPSLPEPRGAEGRAVAFAEPEPPLPSREDGGGDLYGMLSAIEQRLAAIESSLTNAMGYSE